MRSSRKSRFAAAALAQAAGFFPAESAFAGGAALPQDLWLPGPVAVEHLLMDLQPQAGGVILVQGCEFDCGNDSTGNDTVGNDTVGNDTVGNDTVGNDTVGNDTVGNDTVGNDTVGNDTVGNDTVGNDTVGNDTVGNDTVGNDTVGNDTVGNDTVDGGELPEYAERRDGPAPPVLPAKALTEKSTDRIAGKLAEANLTCANDEIPIEYRIDCLRRYYLDLANALPDTGDYVPIKRALLEGAARLDAIVRKNLDPAAPKIRPQVAGKPDAPRIPSVRAIKKSSVKQAAAEAADVIADTSLVILRSGEDPAKRTAHYQEVAEAVDSNLVILRST